MKRFLLAILAITLASSFSIAQHYPLGLNPSNLRWRQINTDKVQVIFPEGLEQQGNRVANIVHYLHDHNLESIGEKQGKVSIILQNQSVVSNGFVALSPFRSEFFMTPPQFNFLGTGNWLDLLTIHEYRHVQQTFNSRRGITGLGASILGQNTFILLRRLALPRWYLEGDAVCSETALTNSGRGRLPDFDMEYRSLRLSERHYGYEKAQAESLKDFVPDHYKLGYYLTAYGRKHYGEDLWQKVLANSVKYKSPFPFSLSIKKYTGMNVRQFYRAAMTEMDSIWQIDQKNETLVEGSLINDAQQKKTFISYQNPQYLNDDQLIVEKIGYNQIRSLYLINLENGQEQLILRPGITTSVNRPISAKKGKIVWEETQFHPRWGMKNYSIIKIAELANENGQYKAKAKIRQLTHRTKYFSPSLSSDATKIVTVEVSEQNRYQLVVLDANTGDIIARLENPENTFYSFPIFSNDGNKIFAIAQKEQQQAVVSIDISTGETEELTSYNNKQLSNLSTNENWIYFSGTFTDVNNIYVVNIQDKKLFRLTNASYGAFQPAISPNQQHLVYSSFSALGNDLRKIDLSTNTPEAFVQSPKHRIVHFQHLAEQERGSILEKIPQEKFDINKFNKINGLINPHSLQPLALHPNYSIELQSENKISTLNAGVGYRYNANERNGGIFGNITFAEFFPVFQAGFQTYNRRERLSPFLDDFTLNDTVRIFRSYYVKTWEEQDYYAGILLPLNFTKGNHSTTLSISGLYHILNLRYQSSQALSFTANDLLRNGQVGAADLELRFRRAQVSATQFINPRFAQQFSLQYRKTLMSSRSNGQQINGNLQLFFPGLFKNHSFVITGAFQQEDMNNTYLFRDNFFYPRGYNALIYDRIQKTSLEYALPIVYPDLSLGFFAFIQRIKLNVFADYARTHIGAMDARELPNDTQFPQLNGFIRASSEKYRSIGTELTFDFRILRLLNIDMGVRYSYLFDTEKLATVQRNQHQVDVILLRIGG